MHNWLRGMDTPAFGQ